MSNDEVMEGPSLEERIFDVFDAVVVFRSFGELPEEYKVIRVLLSRLSKFLDYRQERSVLDKRNI